MPSNGFQFYDPMQGIREKSLLDEKKSCLSRLSTVDDRDKL